MFKFFLSTKFDLQFTRQGDTIRLPQSPTLNCIRLLPSWLMFRSSYIRTFVTGAPGWHSALLDFTTNSV